MLAPIVFTILSLGDSYTIGEGVAPEERWPVQLAVALQSLELDVRDPQIIARTGWTTDELRKGIEETQVEARYDWVTVLIGVNNQYRGRSPDEYRKELRELLRYAVEKAGSNSKRVIVLSIPDWGVTPFAKEKERDPAKIAMEIDTYNRVKREESEQLGVHFVDITDISREAGLADRALPAEKRLLADDGLHPSGTMYQRWVERVLPIIREEHQLK
ncbi:MAG: SGNH/GDSL hydrolase family protein [Planctomycetota bacterium]|jgi:lysophospholipase L1-like esterase